MIRRILLLFFLSLTGCIICAQFNYFLEYEKVKSNEAAYLKKAEKKIRRSECYKILKKKNPSIVDGILQIEYNLRLKKKLTREEFTYCNIMDNLEFRYYNSRKFPDNNVYIFDATTNSMITYEESSGIFCSYDYNRSGGSDVKKYIIPSHITIDNVKPDFIFTLDNVGGIIFLVKEKEIFTLFYENMLLNLNDFVDNYYDIFVK